MLAYTTEGLRHHNRALVLKQLRLSGEATHGDLAISSGLASGTVSVILNELSDEGVVTKVQAAQSAGRGRPKVHFSLVGELALSALVRIASDEVEFSLINFKGVLKDRFSLSRPIDGASTSDFVQLLRQGLNRLAERAGAPLKSFAAVTLSTKGILSSERKTLLWSAAFGQETVNFAQAFHDLGNRLRLIHETSLVSQSLFKGPRPLACLSLGSTIGLGLTRLVRDGLVEHTAPSFSHFCHDINGPLCRCGSNGCIDAHASFYGILRRALDAPANKVGSQVIPREEILALAAEARRGNRNFQIAFHNAGEALGLGLSRLASVYGPLDIVATGAGVDYFDLLKPTIEKHLGTNLLARLGDDLTLTVAQDEPALIFDALRANTLTYIEESLVAPRRLGELAA